MRSSPVHPISVRDWCRRPPLRLRGEFRREGCWVWVWCASPFCRHKAVVAIVPFVIRWGPDDWPAMLRQNGRCSKCGHHGLTISHAGWGGSETRWLPMPYHRMAPVPRFD